MKNQCDRILKYLGDFGSITQMEAISDLGIMRLASRITITHKTAQEMAEVYHFNEQENEYLSELLSDEYASMWSAVMYGIAQGNGEIVAVAQAQLGNTGETYWSYMGYESRVEWCACFVSWCANECGYVSSAETG